MDGKTITGNDVVYITGFGTSKTHRYQWDRDKFRHQGRRNILKNGINNDVTIRVCNECHIVREDYISAQCPECGSRRYRRF